MFTPTGLLKMVVCPGGSDCTAINCIFSHEFGEKSSHEDDIKSIERSGITQPDKQSMPLEPQAKRRKLSIGLADDTSTRSAGLVVPFPGENSAADTATGKTTTETRESHERQDKDLVDKFSFERKSASAKGTSATSIGRSSAPTPAKTSLSKASIVATPKSSPGAPKTTAGVTPAAASPRSAAGRTVNSPSSEFRPRPLKDKTISVAQQLQRKTYLKHIFAEMKRLNGSIVKSGNKDKANVIMDEPTLMHASIEVEYEVAQGQPSTVYSNYIRRRIADLKKMKLEDWAVYVQKTIMTKDNDTDTLQSKDSAATEIKTGLSVEQELKILRKRLLVSTDMLRKMDYILHPPTPEEIEAVPGATTEIRDRLLNCDRCKTTFKVDPDRLEGQEDLTTNGPCCSHWGKLRMPPKVTNNAPREPAWTCCGRDALSAGCTETKCHVYRLHGAIDLSYTMPFLNTPVNDNPLAVDGVGRVSAIAFDCEMAYTVLGLEVVRLTAVCWPGNQPMVDVLVRPKGTMLDFNSRFSGVRAELFEKAYEWKAGMPTVTRQLSADDNAEERPLPIVSSPEVARSILCSYMTPDTVLIGHGLENDLNALRLCHDKVVDTAALYPHPAGLPIRYGLKQLAFTHLSRDIQTGGASGHDSLEDAVASGDLVRVKVGKKARELRAKG